MTRLALLILVLSACDRGVSKKDLEAEVAKMRLYADRAVEVTWPRAWYCTFAPQMPAIRQQCTRAAGVCGDNAASNWGGCVVSLVAWCAAVPDVGRRCFLTRELCVTASNGGDCVVDKVENCWDPSSADDPFCDAWRQSK